MAREINLVPDIKGEMIKALKLRNFIFFLCFVVSAASIGATVIFGIIVGGQQLALDSKKASLDKLSSKVNSYSDLDDFLSIKDQLGNLSKITSNKKVLSRTFGILKTLLPTGADTITISELSVDLSGQNPTFAFDAQANSGSEPFIDYNVLDSFKKSMQFMHYDYGNYVDKDGNKIPAYCITEYDNNGALLSESGKGVYAYWTINAEGCNTSKNKNSSTGENSESSESSSPNREEYSTEVYNGEDVVRIWRTPQFNDWYGSKNIDLNGKVTNIPHFESMCITYTGDDSQNSSEPKWEEKFRESCGLVPEGVNGITISDSSNGRDSSDELVLRFSATIKLSPEVYRFSNNHVITVPPSGRINVTDSYVQLQSIFKERASDCDKNDASCNSDTTNNGGGTSGNNGGNNNGDKNNPSNEGEQ